jgi:protein SCO1/2
LWIGVAVTILFLIAWFIGRCKYQNRSSGPQETSLTGQALPAFADLPEFQLIDSRNQVFHTSRLADKIWIANFIFTSCTSLCPILSAEMSKLVQEFRDREHIHFVSISVDPETDTPEKLSEYQQKFRAPKDRWHFLTGDKAFILELMNKGFKLGFDGDPVFHTDYFVLVDGARKIRGFYSQADEKKFRTLPTDIQKLAGGTKGPWLNKIKSIIK